MGFINTIFLFYWSWDLNTYDLLTSNWIWLWQVASWDSIIGVASCLKWAPRRVMFAAASKGVLTFWIPKDANSTAASFEYSKDKFWATTSFRSILEVDDAFPSLSKEFVVLVLCSHTKTGWTGTEIELEIWKYRNWEPVVLVRSQNRSVNFKVVIQCWFLSKITFHQQKKKTQTISVTYTSSNPVYRFVLHFCIRFYKLFCEFFLVCYITNLSILSIWSKFHAKKHTFLPIDINKVIKTRDLLRNAKTNLFNSIKWYQLLRIQLYIIISKH